MVYVYPHSQMTPDLRWSVAQQVPVTVQKVDTVEATRQPVSNQQPPARNGVAMVTRSILARFHSTTRR